MSFVQLKHLAAVNCIQHSPKRCQHCLTNIKEIAALLLLATTKLLCSQLEESEMSSLGPVFSLPSFGKQ